MGKNWRSPVKFPWGICGVAGWGKTKTKIIIMQNSKKLVGIKQELVRIITNSYGLLRINRDHQEFVSIIEKYWDLVSISMNYYGLL